MITLIMCLVSSIFISCSDKSKMISQIEGCIQKTFNDPNSYQNIEYRIDTITINDIVYCEILSLQIQYESDSTSLIQEKEILELNRGFNQFFDVSKDIKECETNIKMYENKCRNILSQIKELRLKPKNNNIAYYIVFDSYRAKNGLGGYIKGVETYYFNTNIEILNTNQLYSLKEKFLKL